MKDWYVNFTPDYALRNYEYLVKNGTASDKVKIHVIPRYWESFEKDRNVVWAYIITHDCPLSKVTDGHVSCGDEKKHALEITHGELKEMGTYGDSIRGCRAPLPKRLQK